MNNAARNNFPHGLGDSVLFLVNIRLGAGSVFNFSDEIKHL